MSDDALRAAAEAVIDAWGAADQAYEMVGAIGALNDALASSRPEPLDVDRLADIMYDLRRDPEYGAMTNRDEAEAIAREYDRLGDKG
jgi:hypothetical protein